MYNYLMELPGYILDMLLPLMCFLFFTNKKIKDLRWHILWLLTPITSCAVSMFAPAIFSSLIGILATILVLSYTFSETLLHTFLAYSVISFLEDLLTNIILVFLPVSIRSIESPIVQICGLSSIILLLFVLCLIFPVDKFYDTLIHGKTHFRLIVIGIYAVTLSDVWMSKLNTIDNLKALPIIILATGIILIMSIIVLNQDGKIDAQNKEIESFRKYQPTLESLIDSVLASQHDYNNQLQAIKALPLTHNSYEALSAALLDFDFSADNDDIDILKISHKVLGGFIYSKAMQAKKSGIIFKIHVRNTKLKSHMPEYELIRVAGIIIDNAIEASKEGETVVVNIDGKDDRTTIQTLNNGSKITDELQKNIFTKGYTTKEKSGTEKHGYGLNNLLKLTDKYNGEVYFENHIIDEKIMISFEVIV